MTTDFEIKNGSTDTLYIRKDGKLIELFTIEKSDLESDRLRLHKATCRFTECENDWYISDRKHAFHERKKKEISTWKSPSSCPDHRHSSIIKAIYAKNHETCSIGKVIITKQDDAEKAAEILTAQDGTKQRVYACDKCGGFHLTSLPLEKQQEIKNKVGDTLA